MGTEVLLRNGSTQDAAPAQVNGFGVPCAEENVVAESAGSVGTQRGCAILDENQSVLPAQGGNGACIFGGTPVHVGQNHGTGPRRENLEDVGQPDIPGTDIHIAEDGLQAGVEDGIDRRVADVGREDDFTIPVREPDSEEQEERRRGTTGDKKCGGGGKGLHA